MPDGRPRPRPVRQACRQAPRAVRLRGGAQRLTLMTSPPSDDPRIDELRQRLRSLGYLDAGVDRFVLGPARATRRPAVIALLASLRVGAIAGAAAGPCRGPRPQRTRARPRHRPARRARRRALSRRRSSASPWPRRRSSRVSSCRGSRTIPVADSRGAGRGCARAAGGLVTLLCLVYLTLWWQTVIAGLGWSAPLWTLSALALAAAISLLLGHAVAVASSAVTLAGGGRRRRRHRTACGIVTPAMADDNRCWRARVRRRRAAVDMVWRLDAESRDPRRTR